MITIPLWLIYTVISVAVVLFALLLRGGDWDFVTPLISLGLILCVVIFWIARILP